MDAKTKAALWAAHTDSGNSTDRRLHRVFFPLRTSARISPVGKFIVSAKPFFLTLWRRGCRIDGEN